MKIELGKKYHQAKYRKCGTGWVIAKGQKTNDYVCPWCSPKRKGAEPCRKIE